MKKEYHRLSRTIWKCTYHIIFCPKYRYKVLEGEEEKIVRNQLYRLCGQKDDIEIEEINIQRDHVHMILSIPPKYSISQIMGYLKGKLSRKLFEKQEGLRKRYWGKHLWGRGYCVSTVGYDEEKIRKYVKWQQEQEQRG